MKRYRSFDLMISPVEGTPELYWARVIDSPSGQASVRFRLPPSIARRQDQLALIGGAIRSFKQSRSGEAPAADAVGSDPALEPLDPRTFGEQLFTAIFREGVGEVLQRSLAGVAQQGQGLRIRLRLDEAPELGLLPWEYLYDPSRHRFFGLTNETPVVRYLSLPQGELPLAVARPLRILVLTAAANDLPHLDVAGEAARLQMALQPLEKQNGVEITWLHTGTLGELRQALRRGEHHIFHFIGHGWFDAVQQTYGLLFVDEAGNGQEVAADVLSLTLQNHRPLRFAFLNACDGARQIEGEPFGGVAHQLVQQGLPAVIAMQFPVTDLAAIELTREFYMALADGYPVDAALAQARLAIYSQESIMEWGTPVLFLRTADGRLWKADGENGMENQAQSPAGKTGGGETVGRDNLIFGYEGKGDQVMGDKVGGDKVTGHKAGGDVIVATVGAGANNVGVGKRFLQYNVSSPAADERALIHTQLAQVTATFQQIQAQLDPTQIPMIQFQLQLLHGELTKTADGESPSVTTVTQVGDWLLDNVPALNGVLRALFTLPAVTKVLAKAGPTALAWQQRRF